MKTVLLCCTALALSACVKPAQWVSDKLTPLYGERLSSGAVLHDTIVQKNALTSSWVDCEGGPDCTAQIRTTDGGARPRVTIFMPSGCYLTAARIEGAPLSYDLTVYRGYERPASLAVQKRDLLTLAEGGALVTEFSGCPGEDETTTEQTTEQTTAKQTRSIVFDPDQLTEIGNRQTTIFTEDPTPPLPKKKPQV